MILKTELIKVVNDTLNRSYALAKNITDITKDDPCEITAVAHGYTTGDEVLITDIVGMVELNNLHFTVIVIDTDTFTIGVDSTGYTEYTSGGICIRGDLDTQIISALKSLSSLGNFLQDEFTLATISDRDYYSLPDNFKDLLFVGLKSADNLTIYRPLQYERFEMYKRNIYYNNTSGLPERYAYQSGFLYLRPAPDGIYNMYLWQAYYHPEILTVDSVIYKGCDYILFEDKCRETIELGLLYKVAMGLSLADTASAYFQQYLALAAVLKTDIKTNPDIAYYRDGF